MAWQCPKCSKKIKLTDWICFEGGEFHTLGQCPHCGVPLKIRLGLWGVITFLCLILVYVLLLFSIKTTTSLSEILGLGFLLVLSILAVYQFFSSMIAYDLEREEKRLGRLNVYVGGPLSILIGGGVLYVVYNSIQAGKVFWFLRRMTSDNMKLEFSKCWS